MGHAPSLLALNWKSVAGECVVPLWAGSEAARRRVDDWQCDACMCTPPLQSPDLLLGHAEAWVITGTYFWAMQRHG